MTLQISEKNLDYDQSKLLDELLHRKALKNDAALCRVLNLAPPLISKVRHGKIRISGDVLIRIHETFGIAFSEMRQLMGPGENVEHHVIGLELTP
ncbi:hypothetical protein [Glaciimonas immobilis]|uniref:Transcriptional regulator with XRE-family HTH domain n=1 Tax=Glaciimonas immobilis TaxID=728004 RepID=A0A840RMR8_9BURK|nr:hypothetical protein [Glaciimonas immobilis]KAF3998976.1 hypothetical protein HAV38_03205 [Glaciimonas immobilis]MBB5198392.1 transcriptional regulator with XRE-family HTH domain [Glaciimonas immobilis]